MQCDMDSLIQLRVNEVYDRATVQGEGPFCGHLCTFVRLYGCNLHCHWCDTSYTWDTTGMNGTEYPREQNCQNLTIEEVADHVAKLGVPICVVSGGEPMIQKAGVVELAARLLNLYGVDTHVETNGTRPPPSDYDPIAHYSVSPKLPSAQAGHNALVIPVLERWATHPRAVFKIVCHDASEVRDADGLMDLCGVPHDQRWIMPEGRTEGELSVSLLKIADEALARRLNISPRLHVQVWGMERGR